MRTKSKNPRRRCHSCRKWFRPKPSSETHQKTCSAECRRKRLRVLAKRRRERALESHRKGDRQRQKKCRERRRAAGLTVTPSVSRSGLSSQPLALDGVIGQTLDKLFALSRSTLLAELRRAFGEIGHSLGQGGPERDPSHAPAPNG